MPTFLVLLASPWWLWTAAGVPAAQPEPARAVASTAPVVIRVATFNLQDVRTEALLAGDDQRLRSLAAIIQELRPNIILLNELAFGPAPNDKHPDQPVPPAGAEGSNAKRFIDRYLNTPQTSGPREPAIRYRAFTAPINTGMPSGFDLNNDGKVVLTPPAAAGEPGHAPSKDAIAYAEDCWGFGTFPGQYGMALLVDERLELLANEARTFRLLPWDYLPGAMLPLPQPAKEPGEPGANVGEKPWFDADEIKVARLSSKSHWDIPVKLPSGVVLHVLCAHPTPPAFDGPEQRNARRNHDEIRLIADYIKGESYLVDDRNQPGGLPDGAPFVILGDLNADPDEGQSIDNPVGKFLFSTPRINDEVVPKGDITIEGLDDDDTAMFKMRVDYVLPSRDLAIIGAGVRRTVPTRVGNGRTAPGNPFPSDHFPVWMDLRVDP